MNRLRRISPVLLASWLIVAVFVASRVPLLPRAIRHGWHAETAAHYHPVVMARAFVQEGGRTPYFLFPRWSARPDGEEPWLLYTSWPPLSYYVLTPIVALSRDPQVQIVLVRLFTTLITAVASFLVFRLFLRLTQDDGLALAAQAVGTFELHRYYFADLPFASQYGYTLGLIQILLILAIVSGASSKRQIWGAHLVSSVASLTWWLNSLIPPTALALCYVLKAPATARRAISGVAVSSTLVALATFSWLAVAELNQGVKIGTGVVGDGLQVLANIPLNWLSVIWRFGPINVGQTYLESFVRFVLPPFPFLLPDFSVWQQLTARGLLPRYSFSLDQLVSLPLALLLGGVLGVVGLRGIRACFAECADSERRAVARFGLLLFALPGLVFVALLPSWNYAHHIFGRLAMAPIGIVLAVGAYREVRRLIPKHGAMLLAGWLTIWAAFGVSTTYSMVRTFDDSYNRAELAALDWFRQHARSGSVLLNNIPAYDNLHSPVAIFYSDARTYSWWSGLARRLVVPIGFVNLPTSGEALPYLDEVLAALYSVEGSARSDTIQRTQASIQALREAVGRTGGRPEAERDRQELLDLYSEAFATLRSLNRELRERGLSPVPIPLPVSWSKNDNYLLLREDFGLPPLLRGIAYAVVFENEYSTAPGAFLGARTAYNLICHEEVQGRRVPIRCRQAVRRAMAAILRRDWQTVRSLSFITPQPSHDNFEFPIRGDAKPAGKIRLLKLEGE